MRLGTRTVDAYLQRHYTPAVDEIRFTWDPRKASANQRRHRVPFGEAETVFSDDNAILLDDAAHSDDEPRYALLASASDSEFSWCPTRFAIADEQFASSRRERQPNANESSTWSG